jgi:transcriptional regulator with XRE-family HTH domain
MAPVRRWTGVEAKALRQAMRLSVREFAEYIGVDRRTVNKWEARGGSITLLPDTQGLLDSALRLADEEVRARFGADARSEDSRGEEADTNRRDVTMLLGLELAMGAMGTQPALDAVDRLARNRGQGHQRVDHKLVQGHREVAQAIAGLYRGADPRSGLPVAVAYADDVLALLDGSMSDPDRAELGGIVAGVHAQIGLWACHLHRPAMAYRYLATACYVAEETRELALRARTLGAFSYLFSSAPRGGHGGDPRRAVILLTKALALASRADGFTVGWLATWRADQYATLGDLDAAQRDVEAGGQGLSANDDGSAIGFFARPVYGYGMREHCDSVRAFTMALAGQTDDADRTFSRVLSQAANMRRRIATHGHQALARVRAGEPEMACAVLSQAADLAVDNY